MYGGLLIYVIPYYRLTSDICRILVDNFDKLSVWRFADAEFKKFKQVAVMGIRKKRGTELQDTLWLEQYAYAPASIPLLSQLPESRYAPRAALGGQYLQGGTVQSKGIGAAA